MFDARTLLLKVLALEGAVLIVVVGFLIGVVRVLR